MGLWERIRGEDAAGAKAAKMSPHTLSAIIAEFARGEITGPEAIAAFDPPLDLTEQQEATAIKDAVVAGTVTRSEVDDVWHLVERRVPPYDDKATTATRLGF